MRKKGYEYVGSQLLLIDKLEDERYRVFLPKEDLEEILQTKEELREYLGQYDSEEATELIKQRVSFDSMIKDLKKERAELQAKIDVLISSCNMIKSLANMQDKVKAAFSMITCNENFCSTIRHVSISELGGISLSPMKGIPTVSEDEEEVKDES